MPLIAWHRSKNLLGFCAVTAHDALPHEPITGNEGSTIEMTKSRLFDSESPSGGENSKPSVPLNDS